MAISFNDPKFSGEPLLEGTPLRGCCGMALDADGTILVGNVAGGRISRINPDTGEVTLFTSIAEGVLGVDDITTDGKGNFWTACMSGLGGESIFHIDSKGRRRILYSGLMGFNGIQFNRVTGRLFAGQFLSGNGLYELDPDGRTAPRLINNAFKWTNAMDFDRDHNILLTVDGGRIARINPDTGETTILDVRFPRNSAVKVGRDGEMYVSGRDEGFGAVWRVDEEGREKTLLSGGVLPAPDNILYVSPSHRLFVSTLKEASVIEIDLKNEPGKILQTFSPPSPPQIGSMAAIGRNIYFSSGFSVESVVVETGERELTPASLFAGLDIPVLPGAVCVAPDDVLYLADGYQIPLHSNAHSSRVFEVEMPEFNYRAINNGLYEGVDLISAICADNEFLYVAEFATGKIIAFSRDADEAKKYVVAELLCGPISMVCRGRTLFVAECLAQRVSAIELDTGRRNVLVAAGIGRPGAIALSADGEDLFLLDVGGGRLLTIDAETGSVNSLAEQLPVEPIIASHWPHVVVGNGLAVMDTGVIVVGGNSDGSIWLISRSPP